MKKLTMGIVAHVDSGKTTLSEALLYKSGEIRNLGRVDHKNTLLDSFELERNRGITIFSKQAHFKTKQFEINLIDTPGHVDFSAETERTLSVLDFAVIVVSAMGGVQSHTVTLWQLLRKMKLPTIIFVNKMDVLNADKETLCLGIKKKLSQSAVEIDKLCDEDEITMCNERIMEMYLDGKEVTDKILSEEFSNCRLFPIVYGSALNLTGVDELVNAIDLFAPRRDYKERFGARVYKINHDDSMGKINFVKITGGKIAIKDTVKYNDAKGNELCEKITGIRVYQGEKFTNVNEAHAGDVCALLGLSSLLPGDALGFEMSAPSPSLKPVLCYSVILPRGIDDHTALTKLRILEVEDPTLRLEYNEHSAEIRLYLMGEIQLETLKHEVKTRFGFDIAFSEGSIVYRETIENEVEGIGHYEPLRHYSEVHLLLTPLPRGSGLVFDSECDSDFFEINWQRLVLTHLEEKTHLGVLTGSPITDMKITLVSGRAHKKHTEGGDFRQSTYRAVRQGLMKAKSVLLEPYYDFELTLPTECVGRAMTDIDKMGGSIFHHEADMEEAVISGNAPVSALRLYPKELASYSHGKGKISFKLSGYDVCHNTDEVLAKTMYNPEADLENSPDSIFCEGGGAVFVRWSDVENYMHLPSYYDVDKEQVEQQKQLKARAERYIARAATDDELMEIFERTYGPIKPKIIEKVKVNPSMLSPEQRQKKQKPSHMPTGPEYLLIDGYNIIFAWDEMKKTASQSLEDARISFIERLCNYQGFYGGNIILVFDAYKVHKGVGSVEDFRNIKVVYTKEAETADTYIEKTAHKLSKDHIVRVATSDGPEQMIILGSGALRVPASALIKEILDGEKAIREILG